jgi:NAD-dependent SIR2 family protein deacetylase
VWFGEPLPEDVIAAVDAWVHSPESIDLILVVGTSAAVYPAALYIDVARDKGARVAVINMDPDHMPRNGLKPGDWFFQGDASAILPEILKDVVGEV